MFEIDFSTYEHNKGNLRNSSKFRIEFKFILALENRKLGHIFAFSPTFCDKLSETISQIVTLKFPCIRFEMPSQSYLS